jgi:hypothetical protein
MQPIKDSLVKYSPIARQVLMMHKLAPLSDLNRMTIGNIATKHGGL